MLGSCGILKTCRILFHHQGWKPGLHPPPPWTATTGSTPIGHGPLKARPPRAPVAHLLRMAADFLGPRGGKKGFHSLSDRVPRPPRFTAHAPVAPSSVSRSPPVPRFPGPHSQTPSFFPGLAFYYCLCLQVRSLFLVPCAFCLRLRRPPPLLLHPSPPSPIFPHTDREESFLRLLLSFFPAVLSGSESVISSSVISTTSRVYCLGSRTPPGVLSVSAAARSY